MGIGIDTLPWNNGKIPNTGVRTTQTPPVEILDVLHLAEEMGIDLPPNCDHD